MAQRAYRQRKESTLDELRKRVSDLTNTAELMNKIFLDCRDRLFGGALPEYHVSDLRETSTQYETLMKVVRNPGDEVLSDESQALTTLQATMKSSSTDVVRRQSTEVQNVPAWLDEAVLAHLRKQTPPQWGYVMSIQEAQDAPQMGDQLDYGQLPLALGTSIPNRETQSRINMPMAQMPDDFAMLPELTPPITYSFQETSFARRLHRACLEGGYHLMLDPTRRPQTYERVFRLSLMGRNKAKLTSVLKMLLSRGPHESLDLSESALIHVGGAGTHYGRSDQFGNWTPKKESYNLGLIGPQTLALLQDAAQNNITTDSKQYGDLGMLRHMLMSALVTVEIAGYEGEWFDPYDVEGYLEEKGIHIDPSTSFAEAEITDGPPTPSSATVSSAAPETPPIQFPPREKAVPYHSEQLHALDILQADPSQWDDLADVNFSGVGYSDASTGSWMNFLTPTGQPSKTSYAASGGWPEPVSNDLMADTVLSALGTTVASNKSQRFLPVSDSSNPASPRPRTRSVIIDVSKFVKGKPLPRCSFLLRILTNLSQCLLSLVSVWDAHLASRDEMLIERWPFRPLTPFEPGQGKQARNKTLRAALLYVYDERCL